MIKKYYIYKAMMDNTTIYIGKGTGKRYKHCYAKWPECEVFILEYFESEDVAYEKEKFMIEKYGRIDLGTGTLLNKNNGGRYIKGCAPWKNKKLSDSHRNNIKVSILKLPKEKLSNPRFGENNHFYGKKHSIESKKKISQSHKGKNSPMKGKKHTKESIEKNRMSHLGKPSKKKINIDLNTLNELKYIRKMTNQEIATFFNCSLSPIKRAIKELKIIENK